MHTHTNTYYMNACMCMYVHMYIYKYTHLFLAIHPSIQIYELTLITHGFVLSNKFLSSSLYDSNVLSLSPLTLHRKLLSQLEIRYSSTNWFLHGTRPDTSWVLTPWAEPPSSGKTFFTLLRFQHTMSGHFSVQMPSLCCKGSPNPHWFVASCTYALYNKTYKAQTPLIHFG